MRMRMKTKPRKDGVGSKVEGHEGRELPLILSDAYCGTCETNKFLALRALRTSNIQL